MKEFFVATIYTPLYNVFVGIIDLVPTHEVFWAAIIFTVLIKLILSPLAKSAMVSQIKIKAIQGDLKKIQADHKDEREVLAKKMMDLYRDNDINPLSPILVLLIQIPIILSLFFIFKSGLPLIDSEILYSFVQDPGTVEMVTFGIDLAAKSLPLAVLTGITQYLYTKRTFAQQASITSSDGSDKKKDGKPEFGAEFQKMITFQFTYIMPIVIVFIAYSFASVLALYWTTSNIFAYLQDIYIRRKIEQKSGSDTKSVVPEIVSS